ncbi:hypothetical protein MGI18_15360 [Bacillus sp. OVS6]|nr:hypothetical protein MGI18_15360 [Bacillus sp. OVS6]
MEYKRINSITDLLFKSMHQLMQKFPSSWNNNGQAVTGLDLGFLPMTENLYGVDADLIVSFIKRNDSVLSNKPRRMGRNDRKFGD